MWVFGFLSQPPAFSAESWQSCLKIQLASAVGSPWKESGEEKRNVSAVRTEYFLAPEQSGQFTKYLLNAYSVLNTRSPGNTKCAWTLENMQLSSSLLCVVVAKVEYISSRKLHSNLKVKQYAARIWRHGSVCICHCRNG